MNSSNPNDQSDDEIDLGQLFINLWNGKWIILVMTLLVGSISVITALNTPPTYQADALLQLEEQAGANPFSGAFEGLSGGDARSVTEIELIKSRLVLGEAIAEQNLDWVAVPRYLPLFGHLVSKYGEHITLPAILKPYAQSGEAISLRFLQLSPTLLGETLVLTKLSEIEFSVQIPDGQLLLGRLNEPLVDTLSGVSIEVGLLVGEVGREFLVAQISEEKAINNIRNRVGVSEKGRASGVLSITFKDGQRVEAARALDAIVNAYLRQNIARNSAEAENSLSFIDDRIPEVRKIVDDAESRLKNLQSERNTLDLSFETQALLQQKNTLEADLTSLEIEEKDLQRKFTANHPTYKTLLVKKEKLTARLQVLQKRSQNLPETQREIFDLTQDLQLARETYSKLLLRAQELRVVKASTIGNVRVIDRAQSASKPVAPKNSRIVALGTLLGLMVGVGLVLIRQMTARGIHSSSEIEALGLPVFAVINKVSTSRGDKKKFPIHAIEHPTDLAVEAFRGLRTSLHFGMLEKDSKVLAITSTSPAVGKSFCAMNLAVVSAQAGLKVCLIDADLRRGEQRKFFDLKSTDPGLSEFLSGSCDLQEAIKPTSTEGLSFVATGRYPPNPADLLMLPAFDRALKDLSEKFDLIILDCPPVLAVTDPVIVSKQASMTLAVVSYGVTTEKEMQAMLREISASGGHISGAVLNSFERSAGNAYGTYDYRYEYK